MYKNYGFFPRWARKRLQFQHRYDVEAANTKSCEWQEAALKWFGWDLIPRWLIAAQTYSDKHSATDLGRSQRAVIRVLCFGWRSNSPKRFVEQIKTSEHARCSAVTTSWRLCSANSFSLWKIFSVFFSSSRLFIAQKINKSSFNFILAY